VNAEPDHRVECLATGFGFTEGPVWDAVWDGGAGALLFSDLEHDVRRRWSAGRGIEVVSRDTSRANGMVFDGEGRLLVCEHVSSTLVRLGREGEREVLASHFEGRQLNSPNDVVVRSDGTIFFTDPPYGRINDTHGVVRPQQLPFQGVFAVHPDGTLHLLADDFAKPNGLCFSLDERTLYVADTERMHVRSFAVSADGTPTGSDVFVDLTPDAPGFPDGMRLDAEDNLWTTGPGGLWVVDPSGTVLTRVAIPEVAANLAWGGDDLRDLFVTASTSLYRIRTTVRGAALPHLERKD
jgi:gluconolactonase